MGVGSIGTSCNPEQEQTLQQTNSYQTFLNIVWLYGGNIYTDVGLSVTIFKCIVSQYMENNFLHI